MPSFTVASANVQCQPLMPLTHVYEDVREAAKNASVVGWQEIVPDSYIKAVKEALPCDWRTAWGGSESKTGCPISYDSTVWEYVEQQVHDLHKGVKGISPNRFILVLILRHRASGIEFAFTNKHYIAGAWNNKRSRKDVRQRMWREANRNDRKLTKKLLKRGCVVVGLGDYNSRNDRKLAVGKRVRGSVVQYLVPPSAIDQIFVVLPKKYAMAGTHREAVRARSDHPRRQARLHVEKGRC
jgi:hypothetical protein